MKLKAIAIGLAVSTLLAQGLAAQDDDDKRKPPKPKPDCLDGVKYDDGKFETGYRSGSFDDNFVMLFESPTYPVKLEKVCLNWSRTSFWNDVWFDIRIWNADGPDGAPGTLVDFVGPLRATKIPRARNGKFYNYDVAWANIIIEGPVYIGPFWDPLDAFLVYLAADEGPKTPRRRTFHSVGILDNHAPSVEMGLSINSAPGLKALGIRAKFGPP